MKVKNRRSGPRGSPFSSVRDDPQNVLPIAQPSTLPAAVADTQCWRLPACAKLVMAATPYNPIHDLQSTGGKHCAEARQAAGTALTAL